MRMKALALAALLAGVFLACAHSNADEIFAPPAFDPEAGAEAAPSCPQTCSLDLTSIVRCDGSVVQTCPPEQACGTAGCVPPCDAVANAQSSLGCEFYAQPPATTNAAGSCYAAYIVNAWTTPLTLSISLGAENLDISKAVYRFTPGSADLQPATGPIAPHDAVIVFLSDAPNTFLPEGYTACPAGVVAATPKWTAPEQTGRGTSFHITTDSPASISTIYPFGGAKSFFPTATLLLPIASWGTQHLIVEPWERSSLATDYAGLPSVQIVASEDDTQVNIRPVAEIQAGDNVTGALANQITTYSLAKGEFLQIMQNDELSGSLVEATKPISTFGGNGCMDIPADVAACDVEQKQIPSFAQWGQEYAAVRYRGRVADSESIPYRITAAVAATTLSYDPSPPAGAPTSMNAGELVTFSTSLPFVVKSQDANHPIYVAAYMTGGGNPGMNGIGDPESVNLVPAGQYLTSYTFYADPTYDETSLVVIRARNANGKFDDVTLDCAGGALDQWTPIGTGGNYEFRRVDLIRATGPGETFPGGTCRSGLQRMNSAGPFTATIWGWGITASYAYPGGMAQRNLVSIPLVVR